MLPLYLASAIVIRHDKPDTAYLVPRSQYPAVVRISGMAEGTLIGSRHVLTAAHVVEFMNPFTASVRVSGKTYGVKTALYHPLAKSRNFRKRIDLAILVLAEPVQGISPVPLYAKSDESGQVMALVGAGMTGTGITGMRNYDFKTRRAHNRVDRATDQHLILRFDRPGKGALDDEGIGGDGDSGSPAFLLVNGKPVLAGVTNKNEPAEGGKIGGYDSEGFYARVSTQRKWILDTMNGAKAENWGWSVPAKSLPPGALANCVSDFFKAFNSGTRSSITGFYTKWSANPKGKDPWPETEKQIAVLGKLSPGQYALGPSNRLLVAAKAAKAKRGTLIEFYMTGANPQRLVLIRGLR